MNTRIHILEASGRLTSLKKEIESAAIETVKEVEARITLPQVDIVIADNPESAIPETGVGGNAYDAHFIVLSIDPDFSSIEKNLEKEIKSTLAHELHHCARMNTIGYGKNLFDALVTEGLADHFDMEINKREPRPWSIALNEEQIENLFSKAKTEFEDEDYNHSEWFFGSEEKQIPKWTGYALGFKLIGDYLRKTGKKPSELVGVSASEFKSGMEM